MKSLDKQVRSWWDQYRQLRGLLRYIPDQDDNLIKVIVKELPERWLNNISEQFYNKEVYLVADNSRKKTGEVLVDFLNERFVRSQLELEIPDSDKRDTWYLVEERLKDKGGNDFAGNPNQQYISMSNAIESYCSKLCKFFQVPYWGFVMDELTMKSHARAIVFDMELKGTLLDVRTLEGYIDEEKRKFIEPSDFVKTPFFFLICEKEAVLTNIMKGLKKRGYNKGWYGINTQGYATTNVIRLLLKYQNLKKFYVFLVHDYDLDGLTIFFDLKRYFPCESAGLNPILIEKSKINTKGFLQGYKTKSGKARNKQIKGANSVLNDLRIRKEERKVYREWINGCINGRAEIQALTGYRLNENMTQNPARDFVNYIVSLLEDIPRIYDLNRLETINSIAPNDFIYFSFKKPSFIDEIIWEIQENIQNTVKKFLESKNLESVDDWKELLLTKYNSLDDYDFLEKTCKRIRKIQTIQGRIKAIRIRKKNKKFTKSLLEVEKVLNKQKRNFRDIYYAQNDFLRKRKRRSKKLIERLFKRFPEYREIREKLEELRDSVKESLENIENSY